MSSVTENSVTTVTARVYVGATPEQVWEAIVDPAWSARYGYKCPVSYELEAGGAFSAAPGEEMRAMGAGDVIIEGEVLEVDAPHRLVQTWSALFDATTAAEPAGRLTWEIAEENSVSRLTVTHELQDSPVTAALVSGSLEHSGGGWPWMLSDLKTLLETGSALGT
jgi:uncharacterized protein YndB with AHSA1/START domain